MKLGQIHQENIALSGWDRIIEQFKLECVIMPVCIQRLLASAPVVMLLKARAMN